MPQASMIWIIGEYAERIDNADELLESFLENFPEEPSQVQLQLLTATVKLFLKKPSEGPQQMIQVDYERERGEREGEGGRGDRRAVQQMCILCDCLCC